MRVGVEGLGTGRVATDLECYRGTQRDRLPVRAAKPCHLARLWCNSSSTREEPHAPLGYNISLWLQKLGFSLAFVDLPADPKSGVTRKDQAVNSWKGQPAQVSPVTFESEEEAIALANDTIHGLAAYLYTADIGRGMRVADGIETGMVGINRGLISDPAAPFGGVKESGIGRLGAHDGLNEFLETKYIAVSW